MITKTINFKVFFVDENITEKTFPAYIKKYGFNCIRLSNVNLETIRSITQKDIKFDVLSRPDFFIYKNSHCYFFCEFKSISDALRSDQLAWAIRYDIPWAVAMCISNKHAQKLQPQECPEVLNEIFRMSIEAETKWVVRDNIVNEYCLVHKHKNMFKSKDGFWYGTYPSELSEILRRENAL